MLNTKRNHGSFVAIGSIAVAVCICYGVAFDYLKVGTNEINRQISETSESVPANEWARSISEYEGASPSPGALTKLSDYIGKKIDWVGIIKDDMLLMPAMSHSIFLLRNNTNIPSGSAVVAIKGTLKFHRGTNPALEGGGSYCYIDCDEAQIHVFTAAELGKNDDVR